jgi:signal transduction histidine kinase
MTGLILAALVAVSVLNAYLSVRRTRLQIEAVLTQVTETLAQPNFPLTDSVLRRMRGLVGAEFVLTDLAGDIAASSADRHAFPDLPADRERLDQTKPVLARLIVIGDRSYFHTSVRLRGHSGASRAGTLHILYPEANYRQAWRDVVYPPLAVGGIAIVLVIGLSLAVASRVTRPLGRLQDQVNEIAKGNFRSLPVPPRRDEIADLSCSVNRMAEMLARYEAEVRRNEQLRTLGQLGGGIAHQLRNSVTGCRMAIELHARQCPLDCESLDVAKRQLELMEKYLQKFLSLGRSEKKPHRRVVLQSVVDSVLSLVGPTARHVGVELTSELADDPIEVDGDADALEQLLANLLLNGIEAASCRRLADGEVYDDKSADATPRAWNGGSTIPAPQVIVSLHRLDDRVRLEVVDTGCGPAEGVATRLFEPFVTEKPDGTGLGLSVAQEIAIAHGGQIRWQRRDGKTCFTVEIVAATRSHTEE